MGQAVFPKSSQEYRQFVLENIIHCEFLPLRLSSTRIPLPEADMLRRLVYQNLSHLGTPPSPIFFKHRRPTKPTFLTPHPPPLDFQKFRFGQIVRLPKSDILTYFLGEIRSKMDKFSQQFMKMLHFCQTVAKIGGKGGFSSMGQMGCLQKLSEPRMGPPPPRGSKTLPKLSLLYPPADGVPKKLRNMSDFETYKLT